MSADTPSSAGEDGTGGLGAVPSVLKILRTDGGGRPSDGMVDNTAGQDLPLPLFLALPLFLFKVSAPASTAALCRACA